MARKPQILVAGSSEEHCTSRLYSLAYEVGKEIARRGAILITGGLGGVMEASSRGAKEAGGLVVGIIPHEDHDYANKYCDVVVATGIGWARNFATAYTADAVIIIGGGAGTAIEAMVAYFKGKPIIALKGSGGYADEAAGKYLDDRRIVRVEAASSPQEAVNLALEGLKRKREKAEGGFSL
ncbi:TIGR00725 family protein [Candidatus Bathyarchaeota archaeon]|nr:MAG: TIGR00725 family protein [Candidatus Bathyarchaeota archaeon]